MNSYSIHNDMVEGVVAHMNEDHSDACLAIVEALSSVKTPRNAIMQSIDVDGAVFHATTAEGTSHIVRVPFDKRISRDSQVRGHLVALTKRARAILKTREKPLR